MDTKVTAARGRSGRGRSGGLTPAGASGRSAKQRAADSGASPARTAQLSPLTLGSASARGRSRSSASARGRGRGGRGGAGPASRSPSSQKSSPVVTERKRGVAGSRSSSPATSEKTRGRPNSKSPARSTDGREEVASRKPDVASKPGPSKERVLAKVTPKLDQVTTSKQKVAKPMPKTDGTKKTFKSPSASKNTPLNEKDTSKNVKVSKAMDTEGDVTQRRRGGRGGGGRGEGGKPKGALNKRTLHAPKRQRAARPKTKQETEDGYETEEEENIIGDAVDTSAIEYHDDTDDVISFAMDTADTAMVSEDDSIVSDTTEPAETRKRRRTTVKKATPSRDASSESATKIKVLSKSVDMLAQESKESAVCASKPTEILKAKAKLLSRKEDDKDSVTCSQSENKKKMKAKVPAKLSDASSIDAAISSVISEPEKSTELTHKMSIKRSDLFSSIDATIESVLRQTGVPSQNEGGDMPSDRMDTHRDVDTQQETGIPESSEEYAKTTSDDDGLTSPPRRKPGRPPGAKNKPKLFIGSVQKRRQAALGTLSKGSGMKKPHKRVLQISKPGSMSTQTVKMVQGLLSKPKSIKAASEKDEQSVEKETGATVKDSGAAGEVGQESVIAHALKLHSVKASVVSIGQLATATVQKALAARGTAPEPIKHKPATVQKPGARTTGAEATPTTATNQKTLAKGTAPEPAKSKPQTAKGTKSITQKDTKSITAKDMKSIDVKDTQSVTIKDAASMSPKAKQTITVKEAKPITLKDAKSEAKPITPKNAKSMAIKEAKPITPPKGMKSKTTTKVTTSSAEAKTVNKAQEQSSSSSKTSEISTANIIERRRGARAAAKLTQRLAAKAAKHRAMRSGTKKHAETHGPGSKTSRFLKKVQEKKEVNMALRKELRFLVASKPKDKKPEVKISRELALESLTALHPEMATNPESPETTEEKGTGDDNEDEGAGVEASSTDTEAKLGGYVPTRIERPGGRAVSPAARSISSSGIVSVLKDTIKMREQLAKQRARRASQDRPPTAAADTVSIDIRHAVQRPAPEVTEEGSRPNVFEKFNKIKDLADSSLDEDDSRTSTKRPPVSVKRVSRGRRKVMATDGDSEDGRAQGLVPSVVRRRPTSRVATSAAAHPADSELSQDEDQDTPARVRRPTRRTAAQGDESDLSQEEDQAAPHSKRLARAKTARGENEAKDKETKADEMEKQADDTSNAVADKPDARVESEKDAEEDSMAEETAGETDNEDGESDAAKPRQTRKRAEHRRGEYAMLMANLVEAYGNVPRGSRHAPAGSRTAPAGDIADTLVNLQLPSQRMSRSISRQKSEPVTNSSGSARGEGSRQGSSLRRLASREKDRGGVRSRGRGRGRGSESRVTFSTVTARRGWRAGRGRGSSRRGMRGAIRRAAARQTVASPELSADEFYQDADDYGRCSPPGLEIAEEYVDVTQEYTASDEEEGESLLSLYLETEKGESDMDGGKSEQEKAKLAMDDAKRESLKTDSDNEDGKSESTLTATETDLDMSREMPELSEFEDNKIESDMSPQKDHEMPVLESHAKHAETSVPPTEKTDKKEENEMKDFVMMDDKEEEEEKKEIKEEKTIPESAAEVDSQQNVTRVEFEDGEVDEAKENTIDEITDSISLSDEAVTEKLNEQIIDERDTTLTDEPKEEGSKLDENKEDSVAQRLAEATVDSQIDQDSSRCASLTSVQHDTKTIIETSTSVESLPKTGTSVAVVSEDDVGEDVETATSRQASPEAVSSTQADGELLQHSADSDLFKDLNDSTSTAADLKELTDTVPEESDRTENRVDANNQIDEERDNHEKDIDSVKDMDRSDEISNTVRSDAIEPTKEAASAKCELETVLKERPTDAILVSVQIEAENDALNKVDTNERVENEKVHTSSDGVDENNAIVSEKKLESNTAQEINVSGSPDAEEGPSDRLSQTPHPTASQSSCADSALTIATTNMAPESEAKPLMDVINTPPEIAEVSAEANEVCGKTKSLINDDVTPDEHAILVEDIDVQIREANQRSSPEPTETDSQTKMCATVTATAMQQPERAAATVEDAKQDDSKGVHTDLVCEGASESKEKQIQSDTTATKGVQVSPTVALGTQDEAKDTETETESESDTEVALDTSAGLTSPVRTNSLPAILEAKITGSQAIEGIVIEEDKERQAPAGKTDKEEESKSDKESYTSATEVTAIVQESTESDTKIIKTDDHVNDEKVNKEPTVASQEISKGGNMETSDATTLQRDDVVKEMKEEETVTASLDGIIQETTEIAANERESINHDLLKEQEDKMQITGDKSNAEMIDASARGPDHTSSTAFDLANVQASGVLMVTEMTVGQSAIEVITHGQEKEQTAIENQVAKTEKNEQNAEIMIKKTDETEKIEQDADTMIKKTDETDKNEQNAEVTIKKTDETDKNEQNAEVTIKKTDETDKNEQNAEVTIKKTDETEKNEQNAENSNNKKQQTLKVGEAETKEQIDDENPIETFDKSDEVNDEKKSFEHIKEKISIEEAKEKSDEPSEKKTTEKKRSRSWTRTPKETKQQTKEAIKEDTPDPTNNAPLQEEPKQRQRKERKKKEVTPGPITNSISVGAVPGPTSTGISMGAIPGPISTGISVGAVPGPTSTDISVGAVEDTDALDQSSGDAKIKRKPGRPRKNPIVDKSTSKRKRSLGVKIDERETQQAGIKSADSITTTQHHIDPNDPNTLTNSQVQSSAPVKGDSKMEVAEHKEHTTKERKALKQKKTFEKGEQTTREPNESTLIPALSKDKSIQIAPTESKPKGRRKPKTKPEGDQAPEKAQADKDGVKVSTPTQRKKPGPKPKPKLMSPPEKATPDTKDGATKESPLTQPVYKDTPRTEETESLETAGDAHQADNLGNQSGAAGKRKRVPWTKARMRRHMQKARDARLSLLVQAKQRAKSAAAAQQQQQQHQQPQLLAARRSGRGFKKRSEIELLFDVDGPPSKKNKLSLRKHPPIPEQEKKTILGQRIELGTKRPQMKRMRHWSETSLSSADLETPDSDSRPDKTGPGLVASELAGREQPEPAPLQELKSIAEAEQEEAEVNPDFGSSPDSDSGKKMTTRGKKNRYWYLFAKQDRKGNIASMLSKPDNADMAEYEQWRQAVYPKKHGGDKGVSPEHRRSPRPSTPGADGSPSPGAAFGGYFGEASSSSELNFPSGDITPSESSSDMQQLKVPKLVLKIPKKAPKRKKSMHEPKSKLQKQYPTIEPVEPSPECIAERDTPPLISKIILPPRGASPALAPAASSGHAVQPGSSRTELQLQAARRCTERLLAQCRPCTVKLVDLIKFLQMTGNEDMIPAMPDPFSESFDKVKDNHESKTEKADGADTEPPVLTQTATPASITPPKTAYEKQFMSFIDQKQKRFPYLGPGRAPKPGTALAADVSRALGETSKEQVRATSPHKSHPSLQKSVTSKTDTDKATVPSSMSIATSHVEAAATTVSAVTAVNNQTAAVVRPPVLTTHGIVLQTSASNAQALRPILPKLLPSQAAAMLLIPVTSAAAQDIMSAPAQQREAAKPGPSGRTFSKSPTRPEHGKKQTSALVNQETKEYKEKSLSKASDKAGHALTKGPILPKVKTQTISPAESKSASESSKTAGSPGKTLTTISARALSAKVQQSDAAGASSLMKGMVPSRKTARKQMKSPTTAATTALTPPQQGGGSSTSGASQAVVQRYRCLCCTYTCSSKTVMAEHIYNHTDIVPYSCGYCGSIFGTKSGVTVHTKRDHKTLPHKIVKNSKLDEDQYFCTIEEYDKMATKGPVPLKTVERMSERNTVATPKPTPGSPFAEIPRETLDSLYSSKMTLKLSQDMSVHETTYQCKFCDFKTIDRKTIEVHVSHSHQKDRRFVCPMCKVSFFKQVDSMRKHIQKWHPGADASDIQYEPGYFQITDSPQQETTNSSAPPSEKKSLTNSAPRKASESSTAGGGGAVSRFSGEKSIRKPKARKSMPAKRKAESRPSLSPPKKIRDILPQTTREQLIGPKSKTNYVSILPKVSPPKSAAGQGAVQHGQHVILNVPYAVSQAVTQTAVANQTSVIAANQIAGINQTPTYQDDDSAPETMLKITNVVSLNPNSQAKQNRESVKEVADSQTPEKEYSASGVISRHLESERNTSPEYMCKEISSTSEETETEPGEIPDSASVTTTETKVQQQSVTTKTKASKQETGATDLKSKMAASQQQQLKKCFQCRICSKILPNFEAATMHISRNHYIDFEYQCPYCVFTCKDDKVELMRRHVRALHREQPQAARLTLVNQQAFFKLVQVDMSRLATERRTKAAPGGEPRKVSVSATQQRAEHGLVVPAPQPRPRSTQDRLLGTARADTVIIQHDEPSVINVAGSTLEAEDQPLDFSVTKEKSTVQHVSSDTEVLDLSKASRLPNLTKPPRSSPGSVTPRPPPPLRPMGIVDGSQVPASTRRQAPPLTRAPVPSADQSAGGTQQFAPGVIMEEGTSSEDEDDIAKECFSVFNLQPPTSSYMPLNIPQPQFYSAHPSVASAHALQEIGPHFRHAPMDHSGGIMSQAGVPSTAIGQYQGHVHQMHAVNQGQVPAHSMSQGHTHFIPHHPIRRAPPPNVVVGGPGMKHTPSLPPQFSRLISCPYCVFKNSSYDVMRSHILSHDNIEWTCPYCPMPQKMAKSVVEKHMMSCHPGADVHLVPYGLHPQNV